MGCFDDIICEYPLPDEGAPERLQTKSLGCTLDLYVITASGRIVVRYGGADHDIEHNGALNFYGYGADHEWFEYDALFKDGDLLALVRVRPS